MPDKTIISEQEALIIGNCLNIPHEQIKTMSQQVLLVLRLIARRDLGLDKIFKAIEEKISELDNNLSKLEKKLNEFENELLLDPLEPLPPPNIAVVTKHDGKPIIKKHDRELTNKEKEYLLGLRNLEDLKND